VTYSLANQTSIECALQFIEIHRFHKMCHESVCLRACPIALLTISGHRDHLRRNTGSTKSLRDLIAVHDRQPQIKKHDLRFKRRGDLQCAWAFCGGANYAALHYDVRSELPVITGSSGNSLEGSREQERPIAWSHGMS